MGQHPVGNNPDVAAHAGNGVQQRQPIQRASGVVRYHNEWAVFGDLFEIAGGNGAVNIKVFQNLIHHIQPFQVTVAGGKLLKFVFVKQSF